jgi:hypothetical protein
MNIEFQMSMKTKESAHNKSGRKIIPDRFVVRAGIA